MMFFVGYFSIVNGFVVKMFTSCNMIEEERATFVCTRNGEKGVKKQLKKRKNMKMKLKAKAEFLHLFMAREKRAFAFSLMCGGPFLLEINTIFMHLICVGAIVKKCLC